ncbi:interleukin-20 receptor subunit beta [Bufo bufo]|uniref:interleukin-20 receptor subunit beta n=1 Tax=Bufo bufo TaxID=8384 RepID=UPI001ABDA82C|nr:interleukin-20 receptor subunit beta [Bufo bufo]
MGNELQVILIALISGSLADQNLFPAPENISMVSTNLKHFLHWDPVMVAGNITYSVQAQGEYESIYMKDHWHDPENCQEISAHQCNVTDEVSASVLYRFRVRSILDNQVSAWVELEPPFNRKTTLLIPPRVDLQVSGLNLVANIEDYGPYFQFYIFYWQKGKKDDTKCKKISSSNTSTFLEKAEEGKEYCAEVIAFASPINKNSSGSDAVCIQVKEVNKSGLFTGLLCVFGVVLAFVPMVLAIWKSANMIRYFCCPAEDVPDVLKGPYIGERMLQNYYSSKDDSEETYKVELYEHMLNQEINSITVKMQTP